jgi:hypothetical protein
MDYQTRETVVVPLKDRISLRGICRSTKASMP